jgi:hypothetical protein
MQFILSDPYRAVNPLRFGMPENEIVSILGLPVKKIRTRRQEHDLRYDYCSIRLSPDSMQLVEIGFYNNADILIDGSNPFTDVDNYKNLIKKDAGVLEFAGVLFLPSYGITLTGFHESNPSEQTVTAFIKGRLDHLLDRFSPFRF